jgi:hypothetical protein
MKMIKIKFEFTAEEWEVWQHFGHKYDYNLRDKIILNV